MSPGKKPRGCAAARRSARKTKETLFVKNKTLISPRFLLAWRSSTFLFLGRKKGRSPSSKQVGWDQDGLLACGLGTKGCSS